MLKLFDHICRMKNPRLVKTALLGMVEGNQPRGRPPRRWTDDIVDWCGCPLPEVVKLEKNRVKWQRITGINGSHGP